jgi:excisionase family DNA binding protein
MAITFTKKSSNPAESLDGTPRPLRLRSVKHSATYAQVSAQTVRRAIKAGELKTYRAGRQIRIDEADLIEWLSR